MGKPGRTSWRRGNLSKFIISKMSLIKGLKQDLNERKENIENYLVERKENLKIVKNGVNISFSEELIFLEKYQSY